MGKLLGEQLSNQSVRLPLAHGLNNGRLGRAILEHPMLLVDGVGPNTANDVAAKTYVRAHQEGDPPAGDHEGNLQTNKSNAMGRTIHVSVYATYVGRTMPPRLSLQKLARRSRRLANRLIVRQERRVPIFAACKHAG
jgi:hypothetical protein